VAPTVRSVGPGTNSGTTAVTTFSPTMPTIVAGDLLIGWACNGGGEVPATRPSGSTSVTNVDDGTVFNMDVVRKTAVGGDVFTWTSASARKWAGCVISITVGTWDTTTPMLASGAAQGGSATATYVTPALTAPVADCLLLAAFGNQAAGTWTVAGSPTNPTMTERCDTTCSGTLSAAFQLVSGDAAPPLSSLTRSGTSTVSIANAGMWIAAVRPVVADGVPRGARRVRGRSSSGAARYGG
jgi:hypothetical protein